MDSLQFIHLLDSDSLKHVFRAVNIDTLIVVLQNQATSKESIFEYKYIIPIGISLIVFVLSQLALWWSRVKRDKRDKIKQIDKDRIEMENKLSYFASLIDSIINYSKAQLQELKNYIEQLSNINDAPVLRFIPKNDIEKVVKKIDDEQLFIAFTKKYRSTQNIVDYKVITSAIEYQNLELDGILSMNKIYLDNINERKIKFNKSIEDIFKFIFKNTEHGYLTEQPEFIIALGKIADNYKKIMSSATLESSYNVLVKPLMVEVNNYQLQKFEETFELLIYLKDANSAYNEIISQRDAFKKNMEGIYKSYKESNEELETESKQLLKDFFDESTSVN